MEKNKQVLDSGLRSIEIAKAAGVKMAYGTDLVWAPQHQSEEFLVRAEVLPPIEIIRSATLIGALKSRLERGEQSLLFLNRRGYAPVIACDACGFDRFQYGQYSVPRCHNRGCGGP